MLGLSFSELALLAFIGILFLKPDELRRMARKAGGWMSDVQRMSREFTRELVREADLQDLRDEVRKIKTDIRNTLDAPEAGPDDAAPNAARGQIADEKPIRAEGEREQAEGGGYEPAFPEPAAAAWECRRRAASG